MDYYVKQKIETLFTEILQEIERIDNDSKYRTEQLEQKCRDLESKHFQLKSDFMTLRDTTDLYNDKLFPVEMPQEIDEEVRLNPDKYQIH
jgi:hypothetical protein